MHRLFFSFILCWIIVPSRAQITFEGRIRSLSGDTVVGANVWIAGSYDGATSRPDGHFKITTRRTGVQTLLVTSLGYDSLKQTIDLNGAGLFVEIRLKERSASLRELVISAGSFEAASDRRRAVVLSPVDIALTASATADIAGAINTLPGAVRNGESGQILVRGGAAYETRTFIDGLYVQNPYNSSVPNVPARNRFSPFLFKGTQFSTGGYSAEYGQALSAALILQTEDLPSQTTTGLSLMSIGAGLAHTRRWERRSLSASGAYTNLAPYFALLPQNIRWKAAPQTTGGELIFRQEIGASGLLKCYGNVSRSDMELQYPDPGQPQQTNPLRLRANNLYSNVSFRSVWREKWTIFAGAALTHNRDRIAGNFSNDQEQQSAQTRLSLSRPIGESWRLKFGGEYLYGLFDETFVDHNSQNFATWRREHYLAGFAEADGFVLKKLVLRAGLRTERSGLLGRANLAPRLSAAYLLGPGEQIAGALGTFFQTPAYEQLRVPAPLQFEQARHYMLTYQRIRNGYTFRVEGYFKRYSRLVKSGPAGGMPDNSGSGYARGVDLFFRDRKSIRNGDYWISYSFLDTRRDYRDFPGPAVPVFAARHNFSLVYKQWLRPINTAIGATYSFQSPRPYEDPNRPGFNESRTPEYHDLSVNASYLFNLGGHFSILYLSATNLLGWKQVYGYQFSDTPGPDGQFLMRAVGPPARHFLFAGLFITFGQRYSGVAEE